MSGEAEESYWAKLQEHRREKLSGKVAVPSSNSERRKRGKDRIVIKVEEKQNSHKFFGQDE